MGEEVWQEDTAEGQKQGGIFFAKNSNNSVFREESLLDQSPSLSGEIPGWLQTVITCVLLYSHVQANDLLQYGLHGKMSIGPAEW